MAALLVLSVLIWAATAPAFTSASVLNSLMLCAKTIIPSLFVFVVLSDYITKKNVLRKFGRPFRSLGYFFGVGEEGMAVYIIGIICGFPIGGRLSAQLFENEQLSKKNAEFLNLFTNNASLGFIFGVVASVTGINGAWIVFLSQLISSIIIAFIFKLVLKIKPQSTSVQKPSTTKYLFSDSIRNGAQAMLGICAAVVIFSYFGDLAQWVLKTDFINIGFLLPIKGIFEFSSGVLASVHVENSIIPAAFCCCFGGLAVFGQVKSVTDGNLNLKFYLPAKLLQGIVGAIIASILKGL